MRTDYLGLEAFVAVAELGSFTRAASALNITPTALSHRIKKLESDLAVQLIIRTTRDVSLTKLAQELLPGIRRDLEHVAEAYGKLQKSGRAQMERLSFACLPTVAYSILGQVLADFMHRHAGLRVELHDQAAGRIYDLVESGEVEFGISIVTAGRWNLDIREFYQEPYLVLMRRDHPLASKPALCRADLIGLPFVRISTQSTNRQLVDEALEEYREGMVWRYEVQSALMAMNLASEGLALTVLPAMTAKLAWRDLVARPLVDVKMSRSLGAITRRGAPLSGPARDLLAMIEERLAGA